MSPALAISTVCVAAGIHVAITAPTPSVPKNRRVMGDYPGIFYIALLILKYGCWLHAIIEVSISIASIIAKQIPESALTQWALRGTEAASIPQLALSSTRTIAAAGVVLGAIGRYVCYREMGRQYTYHVALIPAHSLVTTGPYSIVRHPGYTSGILAQASLLVWHAAPGSWLRESGVYRTPLAWMIVLPAVVSVGLTLLMYFRRPGVEDDLMRKEFGKKWEEWAKVVRYRLIPGVY